MNTDPTPSVSGRARYPSDGRNGPAGAGTATPGRERLMGLVERVTFHSPENGFCVLRVKTRSQRDLVTVVPLGEPKLGDRVLFEPPEGLGARVPYLKTVRGLPGARVTMNEDRTVSVDGVALGRAKTEAFDGRPLEAAAPGIVPDGHFHLHADHPDSHDSRYAEIGFVPRGRILGRALTLPDLPWLGLQGPLVGPEDPPQGIPAVEPAGELFSPLSRPAPDLPGGNSKEVRP